MTTKLYIKVHTIDEALQAIEMFDSEEIKEKHPNIILSIEVKND